MSRVKCLLSVIAAMASLFLVSVNLSVTAHAAELVVPDPSIAPEEVVAIQMKALQFNDNPTPDFGIEQTWNFAHPRNRAMTGPSTGPTEPSARNRVPKHGRDGRRAAAASKIE